MRARKWLSWDFMTRLDSERMVVKLSTACWGGGEVATAMADGGTNLGDDIWRRREEIKQRRYS